VDAIIARTKIDRARAKRILDPALHMSWQVGATLEHLRRRRPVRPFALAANGLGPGPGEALASHADAIFDRLLVAEHIIEPALLGRDDDRSLLEFRMIPDHDLARDRLLAKHIEKIRERSAIERIFQRQRRRRERQGAERKQRDAAACQSQAVSSIFSHQRSLSQATFLFRECG